MGKAKDIDDEELRFIKEETTLYLKNISKTFGSNSALSNVDLTICPGEIMGLLGQNGCGKSTLIKVLSGFHQPDSGGRLWVNGEEVKLPLAPGEYSKYGMSFVHQDLGLVNSLTVAENWALNEISMTKNLHINWKKIKADALKNFAKYNVDINPDDIVENIGPVQRTMLAILRAVNDIHKNKEVMDKHRGLLVLDEPTVFLPRTEVDVLFRLVHRITHEGISVMFVSHDLDEVMELTDKYTVLRDGKNVGKGVSSTSSKNEIIEMILGKKLNAYHQEDKGEDKYKNKKPILKINNIAGKIVRPTQFEVYKGEVLGITGLVGSGFEEIPYLLFGNIQGEEGSMEFNGIKRDFSKYSSKQAVKDKIALIPADRKSKGGVADLEITENVMLQAMGHYRPAFLKKKAMRNQAIKLIKDYEVVPRNPDYEFGQLSGGNAQKVLLAKWIQENPDLLILHEPTQGIDIGARQAIYRLIEELVKTKGMPVICSSSDYEQLEQICDRVLIFVRGRIVKELTGSQITKEKITELCYESAVG